MRTTMTSRKPTDLNITTKQNCFKLEDIKQEDMKTPTVNTNTSQIMFFNSRKEKRTRNHASIPVGDYYKPFDKGWKRELVVRSCLSANVRKPRDVYYISPSGKKLRSLKDIKLHLTDSELSVEDFSFSQKLIGISDPDLEVCRYALPRKKLRSSSTTEIYHNDNSEAYTTTSKRKRKCVQDYTTDEVIHKVCKSRKQSNLNTCLPSNGVFSINNDEPSTSASNRESLCVSADKHFDTFSLNNLNYLSEAEISSSHMQPDKKFINASSLGIHKYEDPESYSITSSGRKRKLPKYLQDYMVIDEVICTSMPRKCSKTNLKASISSNTIFSLNNDEPSTSANKGGSFRVFADKHFDISSLNTLNYLNKIEITSSSETEFVVVSDLTHLCTLTSLTFLKLTHVQNLSLLNIEDIASLTNLEYLCLGNCNNFPNKFGTNVLNRLKKLKILRLEGGQNTCVLNILNVVSRMVRLEQLELLNFDIPLEFGKALMACKKIKKLLLIPIYEMKAHLIIHTILKALIECQQLKCFTFVITEILIKSTKEFNKIHGLNIGDSVPILESVPAFYVDDNSPNTSKGKLPLRRRFTPNPLNVEFIAVSRLQFLFEKLLPGARIKIVTVPDSEILKQCL